MTGRSVSAVKTPSLLSDSEFRGFWVLVRQGEIEIGREGETLPYFHWKDPDPLPVHYYSLSSWTSTVAKWIQNCNFGGYYLRTFRPLQFRGPNCTLGVRRKNVMAYSTRQFVFGRCWGYTTPIRWIVLQCWREVKSKFAFKLQQRRPTFFLPPYPSFCLPRTGPFPLRPCKQPFSRNNFVVFIDS